MRPVSGDRHGDRGRLFTLHKAAMQRTPTSRKSGSNAPHRPTFIQGPVTITASEAGMPNRLLLLAALALFTVATLENTSAVWRGPPQMLATLDNETRDWVKDLRNKFGSPCCDTADGFPVEVDGWDMAGTVDDTSRMTAWEASDARSGYRVRLADGKWHDVPNFALIDAKTNKLGYAVVWLLPRGTLQIYCFLPRSGGLRKVPQALMAPNTALQRFLAPT